MLQKKKNFYDDDLDDIDDLLDDLIKDDSSKKKNNPQNVKVTSNLVDEKELASANEFVYKKNVNLDNGLFPNEEKEDYVFGSYMPSTAATNVNSSKRSVRFDVGDDNEFLSKNANPIFSTAPPSILNDLIKKENSDEMLKNQIAKSEKEENKSLNPTKKDSIMLFKKSSKLDIDNDWMNMLKSDMPNDIQIGESTNSSKIDSQLNVSNIKSVKIDNKINQSIQKEESIFDNLFPRRPSTTESILHTTLKNNNKKIKTNKKIDFNIDSFLKEDNISSVDNKNEINNSILNKKLNNFEVIKSKESTITSISYDDSLTFPWLPSESSPTSFAEKIEDNRIEIKRKNSGEISFLDKLNMMQDFQKEKKIEKESFNNQNRDNILKTNQLENLLYNENTNNLKIKQLSMEIEFLNNTLEKLKKQHSIEIEMLTESFQKRLSLAEETFKKCEERLKQENEIVSSDILEKVRLLEKEKSEMFSIYSKQRISTSEQLNEQIQTLNQMHKITIQILTQEHEEALSKLLNAKNNEIEQVSSKNDQLKHIDSAISLLQSNAFELKDLQGKYLNKELTIEADVHISSKNITNNFAFLQEKLSEQKRENNEEKEKLQNLVAKLELQLLQQTNEIDYNRKKLLEEELNIKRRRELEEQNRKESFEQLYTFQLQFDKEKKKELSELNKQRSELEKEKQQLYKEKSRFMIECQFKEEDNKRISYETEQKKLEIEAMLNLLNDKQRNLENQRLHINDTQKKSSENLEKIEKDKLSLANDLRTLEMEKSFIKDQKEKLSILTEQQNKSVMELKEKIGILSNLKMQEGQIELRSNHLEEQIKDFKIKQDQHKMVYDTLLKERSELEDLKKFGICWFCKELQQIKIYSQPYYKNQHFYNPSDHINSLALPNNILINSSNITETADDKISSYINSGLNIQSNHWQYPGNGDLQIIKNEDIRKLHSYYRNKPMMNNVQAALLYDRSVKEWKRQAHKDNHFLQKEKIFIEALRQNMFQINSHLKKEN